jgi:hypothetical protein
MGEAQGQDLQGLQHFIEEIYKANWNFYTQKWCAKTQYINNTGAPTVKGELVKFDTGANDAVVLTGSNDDECVGVFAEDGEADGALAWIIYAGSAQIMLQDSTSSLPGNWLSTSTTSGRANGSNASPIPARHWEEVGHSCQTVSSGIDVLVRGIIHFN